MISTILFQNSEESDMISEAVCRLKLKSTPIKSEEVMSLMTPSFKRTLFPESDADLVYGRKDGVQITPLTTLDTKRNSLPDTKDMNNSMVNKTASFKRYLQEDESKNCCKRHKSTDDIKSVVNMLAENDELIADGTRKYALPTVKGKHSDLKSISQQTLADVINGHYSDVIDSYKIIDCRYPYEYEGGHIKDAENRYLHETVLTLLQQPASGKHVLIFHCEFSSERGPKMLRFLRSKDRELNKENYPALNFPEIYLLDSGYKAFFNVHPQLCDPISYRPMLHSDYSVDLRHFRTKSKSWTAGEKRRFSRKVIRF